MSNRTKKFEILSNVYITLRIVRYVRRFRKKFYQITVSTTIKNKLDLIKSIAEPSKGSPVSYAELVEYLIEILPSQHVDVLPYSVLVDTRVEKHEVDTPPAAQETDTQCDEHIVDVPVTSSEVDIDNENELPNENNC